MAEHHVGIRTSSSDLGDSVRALLAEHVVVDAEAPPNVSLEEPEPAAASRRGASGSRLWLAYHRHVPVIRARSKPELLTGLLRLLADYDELEPPHDLQFWGSLVRCGPEAVVVLGQAAEHLSKLRSRMERRGWTLEPGSTVMIDSASGKALLRAVPRGVDAPTVAARIGGSLSAQEPRSVPLRGLLVLPSHAASVEPAPAARRVGGASRAQRVAAVVPAARSALASGGQELLAGVVALCDAVEVHAASAGEASAVIAALDELFAHAPRTP